MIRLTKKHCDRQDTDDHDLKIVQPKSLFKHLDYVSLMIVIKLKQKSSYVFAAYSIITYFSVPQCTSCSIKISDHMCVSYRTFVASFL